MPKSFAAVRRSLRLYAMLLRLYPPPFRREFGESMRYTFRRWLLDEARREGRDGIARAWQTIARELIPCVTRAHIDALSPAVRAAFAPKILGRIARGAAAGLLPVVTYLLILRLTSTTADAVVLSASFLLMGLGMVYARGRGWSCTVGAILGAFAGFGIPMLWFALTENTAPNPATVVPLLFAAVATIALILSSYVRLVIEGVSTPRQSFA